MNRGNKKSARTAQGQSQRSKAQINQLKQLVMAELRATGGATQRSRARLAPKGPKTGLSRRGARGNGLLSRGDQLTAKGNPRNSQYGNKQAMPISESEYIGEITPSAYPAFSVQSFPVNPGQAGCFPWLSSIARNFEKYEFDYLAFVYKREVSEYAANGQTGKVIMSFDTDAADPAPISKQEMEDTDPHCDCMPSENMKLVIPSRMLKRFTDAFFVRPGAQPAGTDIKTYDLGALYVACQGTAANTSVGELHVEYRLRLKIPVLNGVIGEGALLGAGGSFAAATPFGAAPVASGQLAIVAPGTGSVITIVGAAIGQEIGVMFSVTGTVISACNISADTGVSGAIISKENLINAAATEAACFATFTVTAASPTVTFSVTATTVTASRLVVTVLSPAPGF